MTTLRTGRASAPGLPYKMSVVTIRCACCLTVPGSPRFESARTGQVYCLAQATAHTSLYPLFWPSATAHAPTHQHAAALIRCSPCAGLSTTRIRQQHGSTAMSGPGAPNWATSSQACAMRPYFIKATTRRHWFSSRFVSVDCAVKRSHTPLDDRASASIKDS